MFKAFTGITQGLLDATGHTGITVKYSHTVDMRPKLLFTISWGVNDPAKRRYNTWKNCIAFDKIADDLKDIKPGDLLHLKGFIVTNAVTGGSGKPIIYGEGKALTREYVIVEFAEIKKKAEIQSERQLSLVA